MIDRLVARGYATRRPTRRTGAGSSSSPIPRAIERVSAHYAPLNDRLGADLTGFEASELSALLRFVAAAQRSTEAEIRRI